MFGANGSQFLFGQADQQSGLYGPQGQVRLCGAVFGVRDGHQAATIRVTATGKEYKLVNELKPGHIRFNPADVARGTNGVFLPYGWIGPEDIRDYGDYPLMEFYVGGSVEWSDDPFDGTSDAELLWLDIGYKPANLGIVSPTK